MPGLFGRITIFKTGRKLINKQLTNPCLSDTGISVLIPVKNGGHYLATAVHSILRQSHQHLELLIINDHSTDCAISQLDKSDKRLKIVQSKGKGIVSALNTGLALSSKDYIARMDSDDIAHPERLSTQLEFLKANQHIQVCGTQVELFRDNEKLNTGYEIYQQWINALMNSEQISKNIFIESPIPHPTVMMHSRHWQQLGGYDDVEWPEDYDLWLRAHQLGFKFAKPPGKLLQWRDHDERLSRASKRYNKKSFIKAKAFYLSQCFAKRRFRIWGSGPTGALIHDQLVANNSQVVDFIDIAKRRIGNTKREKPVVDAYQLTKTDDLILVAVSARGARADIREFLNQRGYIESQDYLCVA